MSRFDVPKTPRALNVGWMTVLTVAASGALSVVGPAWIAALTLFICIALGFALPSIRRV